MIVEYVKERGFKGEGKDPHLTLGSKYLVLSWNFDNIKRRSYLGVRSDDDGYPAIWDVSFFKIVDTRVPLNWQLKQLESEAYRLEPQAFSADFWEKFHDGNEEAEQLFQQEYEKIAAFHNFSIT
ncbi:hypothetical protein PsAD5_01599 [Pseudovibrio sp. Ad5]|uniref:hypothetical protein n=1 Tax=Pseudovibrio sp. Ad5 TaxID=989436 RepID=UPI0007AE3EBE|nr:hypothetical protein [Pseudovibrio sp. Ad5]KZK98976.1 hypothetical protein PsAD5_01599 [Pseudovibrio sp. Ad5]